MTQNLETVRTVAALRTRVAAWRGEGLSVGLVPTMGALHEGHLTLVRQARVENDRVVVTLFVNPRQFRPNEDFAAYPRDEARDAALLDAEGANVLFAPDVEEMYPEGYASAVTVSDLGDILEGAFRPGFFTGVATVCAKLLNQARADNAYFGEKDYQQLLVIRRMARDLDIDTKICGVETVREADGLALSSRNQYLTASERAVAPVLNATLRDVAKRVRSGIHPGEACAWASEVLLNAGFSAVDYVEVRDARTLQPVQALDHPARVLAAAFLGKARLIDNIPA